MSCENISAEGKKYKEAQCALVAVAGQSEACSMIYVEAQWWYIIILLPTECLASCFAFNMRLSVILLLYGLLNSAHGRG